MTFSRGCHEEIRRVGRGCYEETAPVEFRLNADRRRPDQTSELTESSYVVADPGALVGFGQIPPRASHHFIQVSAAAHEPLLHAHRDVHKVDTQCDKLAIVVGRALTTPATGDGRNISKSTILEKSQREVLYFRR